MDVVILAAEACDAAKEIICRPGNVVELFEHKEALFSIGPFDFTRTVFLIFLATLIVVGALYVAFRTPKVVPGKFGVMMESVVAFVRDDVAKGTIGPEGTKYVPYLLTIFLFILVGNLFELTPGVNFPITSRMAIPLMLSVFTYLIFVVVGFAKNGFSYLLSVIWPKSVPVALRWFVGLIEFFSTFVLRPITLAVRLFANLVAGHLMLTLLLVSGYVFLTYTGGEPSTTMVLIAVAIGVTSLAAAVGSAMKHRKLWAGVFGVITFLAYAWLHHFRPVIGLPWFLFGLGIFLFEFVVAVLQAYIFTLLSAVYIQTSVHPEH
ncbi:MAG TPA: F0F1 ATP synthase subunit A [Acidimicrobiia bacterium]